MQTRFDVDDPLGRHITLLQSVKDSLVVWTKLIEAHLTQLIGIHERLREEHGNEWWRKLGLPPLWASDDTREDEQDGNG